MTDIIHYPFSTFNFPETSFLRKRVPKKLFLENAALASSQKKLFKENARHVYWQYTLKPSTCPVLPFKDSEREYLEIAILQVELASQKGHKRMAEMIHRVIPYPLMLGFFCDSNEFALSVAPKRFSQAEQGAFVAERFFTTGWISSGHPKNHEAEFMASLAWSHLPLDDYGALYGAWVDRFAGYECAAFSGEFKMDRADGRMECLSRCREITNQMAELRAEIKNAAFARQVELNMEIKGLESLLSGMTEKL